MSRVSALGCLGAVALLATGCMDEAYEEVESPSQLAAPIALPHVSFQVPARNDVFSQWQLPPTSPWAPYEKLTLLSVIAGTPETVALPQLDAMAEVRYAEIAAYRVAQQPQPDAMWVVDLSGAASVAFGTELARRSPMSVALVPTFNNWPAEGELVPAEETLAAMIQRPPPPSARPTDRAPPVFLLDSWRLAYKDELIDDDVVDNRYMLTPTDFPSADDLLARGLRTVVYVVPDAQEALYEEDDLNATFLAYQDAGITILLVGLADLAQVPEPGGMGWYASACLHHPLRVFRRRTVVRDELFYRRAHGGFGGVHVMGGGVFVVGHGGG